MLGTKVTFVFCVAGLAVSLAQEPSQLADGAPSTELNNLEFVVKLMSPISTKTSKQGDRFTAQVISPEAYQGAVLEGKVTSVKRPKKGNGKSTILFAFETLTQGDATTPITADLKEVTNSKGVKSVDEEGQVIGKSTNKKKLGGAAGGAGLGALLGGLAGGGTGAAIGALAGAAAGYAFAVTLTSSGENMEFAPGAQFTLAVSEREQ